MNSDDQASCASYVIFGFLLVLVLGCSGCVKWYKAGAQAEVYRREGIEMTQWEVFIGAKPAERTINIKEGK